MKRYAIALAMVHLCAVPGGAQTGLLESCASALPQRQDIPAETVEQFRFLCAQVVHSLSTVQPSVGIAFSGGNPVLGTGTTLGTRIGSIPRISVTARANGALAEMPDLFDDYSPALTDETAVLGPMETVGVPVGSVQGDIAIGLFNGFSAGPAAGGIGAVDLLGSVAVLPKISDFGMSRALTNVGVGARVGLLKQGLLAPGISVSGMYRRMGEITFGDFEGGDAGQFSTNLRTFSLRGVVSKGILAFDLALGAGYDRYSSDVGLDWRVTCSTAECQSATGQPSVTLEGGFDGELTTAAWNVFGDLALNLLMLNLVAEVGYQKPTDVFGADDLQDANLPDQRLATEDLTGGRLFGSIGLRISI